MRTVGTPIPGNSYIPPAGASWSSQEFPNHITDVAPQCFFFFLKRDFWSRIHTRFVLKESVADLGVIVRNVGCNIAKSIVCVWDRVFVRNQCCNGSLQLTCGALSQRTSSLITAGLNPIYSLAILGPY